MVFDKFFRENLVILRPGFRAVQHSTNEIYVFFFLKTMSMHLLFYLLAVPFFWTTSHLLFSTDEPYSKKAHLNLQDELKAIQPLTIPSNHPIKSILDSIFSSPQVTYNSKKFIESGFHIRYHQPRSHIIVAEHALMPGYLVKLYLDSEHKRRRKTPGWVWLVRRAKSSRAIASIIKKKKIRHFVVPQKWIYLLPKSPFPHPHPGCTRKNEILVVENMNLTPLSESKKAWKSVMTQEHLEELFEIISRCGGRSYRPDNIAYTKSGKFAFIDTEYPNVPPKYEKIAAYLSPKMAKVWKRIVKNHLDKEKQK